MEPKIDINKSKLFERLGLEGLDDLQKKRIAGEVAELIQSKLSNRVASFLSDSQLQELSKLIDTDNPQAVESYVRQVIPGYDALVQEISDQTIDQLAAQKAEVMTALKTS